MTERIIIAGSGGQGIMLLGKVLAQAAMRQDKFVTWLPSYGAEVRGGTSHCMVTISDTEIGSPYIDKADVLIIMNQPSLERFKIKLKNKGLLIANSSLTGKVNCQSMQISQFPFTDIAIKLGNIKIANMVALGCFLRQKKTVPLESIFEVILDIAPKEKRDLIEINKKALEEGMRLE